LSPSERRDSIARGMLICVRPEGAMTRRQSYAAILVGKSILLREGLAGILRSASFRVLASVSCADDLPLSKLRLYQPLFLVVHTGDDFDAAVEQIAVFRDQHPSGRVAIVSDHWRLDELVSAFRAGVSGYFVDVISCDAFIKSIELVMLGETIFPPEFLSFILDAKARDHTVMALPDENNELVTIEDTVGPQLSPRENLIMRCLIAGDSNKCIARKIDIAQGTVKVHVKAILRKIRVQNRTQAAIWGMNNGSLERTANNKPLLSRSDMNKRLPNPVAEIPEIESAKPVTPAVTNHQAIELQVSPADRLINKLKTLKTMGRIRLRK
jgi:DNA-binding NarL/FixJ family response regulator